MFRSTLVWLMMLKISLLRPETIALLKEMDEPVRRTEISDCNDLCVRTNRIPFIIGLDNQKSAIVVTGKEVVVSVLLVDSLARLLCRSIIKAAIGAISGSSAHANHQVAVP
jgi:hypothetical protein